MIDHRQTENCVQDSDWLKMAQKLLGQLFPTWFR